MAKRTRKIKMSDNAETNVKVFACSRLNKAVKSIEVFGNCFGDKYNWTAEQIYTAEQSLKAAYEAAIRNISTGKKVESAGIKL